MCFAYFTMARLDYSYRMPEMGRSVGMKTEALDYGLFFSKSV
jgi:hypothetical protein